MVDHSVKASFNVQLIHFRITWDGSVNEGLSRLSWSVGMFWRDIFIIGKSPLLWTAPFLGQDIMTYIRVEKVS